MKAYRSTSLDSQYPLLISYSAGEEGFVNMKGLKGYSYTLVQAGQQTQTTRPVNAVPERSRPPSVCLLTWP